ncbi:enoyl-CoA hydratase-related protein [Paracoccus marcusii]|uniref:enoyl-CoA hydratase-related protein n=1 Tax=Paracoccus marcusii TaxID=59779 RepID=UPI002ED4E643|nr:enoyl-CoA hydratase-related protein [Paracoccus marcusii]
MVEGAAGAGLSLALACDMIVSARDARFTAAYVNAGLVPDGGLTAALTACLPPQMAASMALTGQPVGAERLHALGVIQELTEPERPSWPPWPWRTAWPQARPRRRPRSSIC